MTHDAPRRTRGGFTLLEVVLVLAFMAVLALAVYQAVLVQSGLTEAGRRKVDRAQLVRGVVGLLQQDVRSVFTGWQAVSKDAASPGGAPQPESEEDEEGATSAAVDETAVTASGEPISEYEVPAGGVLGYQDAVTLVVRRTTNGLDFRPNLAPDPNARPKSDLRLVRYWLGSPGIDSTDTRVGLVRQEIDYVPDVTAGDDPSAGARTEIVAEEVRSIQFQYFDGSTWYSEWDQTRESAPRAIEIVLAVARLNPSVLAAPSAAEEVEIRRIVVAPFDVAPPRDADADAGGGGSPGGGSGSIGGDAVGAESGPSADGPSADSIPNIPSAPRGAQP
jgi:prepilin-type N-terminal cleavage/methylation domain-containing protein